MKKAKPAAKYLKSKHNTLLHVIRDVKVWENGSSGWDFKINKASISLTVNEVIELVLGKEGDDCKGFCVTEVTEIGDGEFSKVS